MSWLETVLTYVLAACADGCYMIKQNGRWTCCKCGQVQ